MKEIDFLDAVGRVNKQYIEECITYKPPKKMNVWLGRMSAIAACFMIIIGAVLIVNHMNQPVIIDENGFYIENGVLLRYTGSETDVTIPEEVETIADFTFLENANRKKIEVVRLGASVQTVETNAFAGLENLVDIIIAANNLSFVEEDGLIMTSDGSILLHYEREGETTFTIPDSVRFVAAHAVQGTELEEIDFGENIEYIGYYAFASNYKLKAIHLPDSVKVICDGAFAGCSAAVDGTLPESALIGNGVFNYVPFYNSLLAGQMSPGEEIARGIITPSEAVLKSDTDSLVEQFEYVLALLRGDEDYVPSESAMFAAGAAYNVPSLPENIILPAEVSFNELSFADNGWGTTGIHDLQIFLPVDEYTLVFEAYGYDLFAELYWADCRFRLVKVYYLLNPDEVDPDDTATDFGWTAVFTKNGDEYGGITFTHEDGTIIRTFMPMESDIPYVLTFSPDGTRVAIEYSYGSHTYLYIQSLNGDPLMEPNYDHNEYMGRYWGQYEIGSLKWIDNNNIEGVNEFGRFGWNVFEFEITQLDEDGALFDPGNTNLQSVTYELKYHTVYMEIPETWRNQTIYYDLVRRGQGLEDSRMQAADMAVAGIAKSVMEEVGVSEPLTNKNGVTYFSVWEETPQMALTKGTQHYVFSADGSYQLYMYVYVYRDDPENYLETVIQPIVDSVRFERNVTEVTVDKDSLQDWLSEHSEILPPYPYTIHVTGFNTPVTLEMDKYIDLDSITAYDQTLPIYAGINLYGDATYIDIYFFEADDAVIFSWDNSGIGYTYILGDGFAEEIKPGYRDSLCFYPDKNGDLRYKRSNNNIAVITLYGGLAAATGYDDLLYETGPASIKDGKIVLGKAYEFYTINDKYDLDKEFVESGYYELYDSIEEVFAKNSKLPGYTHYDSSVTQHDSDPVWGTDFSDLPPCLSEKKEKLPAPAEDARITSKLIGGSPIIYVFDDDMRFYLAYLNGKLEISLVYDCMLSLPDGYTDGRIIDAGGRGGSGEFCIYVSAKTGDQTVVLGYQFDCGEENLRPYEIFTDNEYTAYFDSSHEWIRWLYDTGNADAFPSSPYTITVLGFETPVVFEMDGYAKPTSITAYDRTVAITENAQLYGNCTFDLFEADGAIIFSCGYYNIGHTYILTKDSTQIIAPGTDNSLHLYPDDAGNLRYQRINNRIADIIQTGGLSAATGYDDLLYCYGDASIVDGELVLQDVDEYYTISDKYDLDQEFENMYSRYHASIQEVFDSHKLYPGGAIYRPTVFEVLLTMSVANIRFTYGTLTLEYSEHGPGQPVYSMKYLPGVLLVFHNWNMDDPLSDNMIPAELILTENCSRDVRGITVGANIEDRTQTIHWSDLWYHVINGTANLQAEFSGYTATYTISGENLNLPAEDTAHEFNWDAWEAEYIQNPTGRVIEMRIELNQ